MRRAGLVACSVTLAVALSCGGPKDSQSLGSPTAPGPIVNPPAPVPAPVPGAPHRYFDSLKGRTDVLAAYSLRDQAMLDTYAHGPAATAVNVTYDFANDPYPNKQDAAKVTIPADQVSLLDTVRLPIPPTGGQSLMVTWDAWWGREFETSHSGLGNYKNFQFASPATRIWTEIKSDFDSPSRPAGAIAMITVRSYGDSGEKTLGPNVSDKNPLSPQAAQFAIAPETWTRYWVFFKPAGGWYEFSLWVADETRDPVLLLNRLQLTPNFPRGADAWEEFWLEYNTSGNRIPVGRGPLVGYARNVVMLRNLTEVPPLLERPTR